MRTLTQSPDTPEIDDVAEAVQPTHANPSASSPKADDYYEPARRGAPRGARRIAMRARREHERWLGGW